MPDYMHTLESRLLPEQRAAVLRVQELAAAEGNPTRMLRELEKGGARILESEEKTRSADLIFSGDVDGKLSAARDEVYDRPGGRPEIRWSSIMEDLRRRDFSVNAVALSLNPASRGLLLDPMNGLADLERREVRTLSIHSFTNEPIRLLSILRYCVHLDFRLETRTEERYRLAIARGLHKTLESDDVGAEVKALTREDNIAGILKAWDQRGLLPSVHPKLVRRRPREEDLSRLSRAREFLFAAGLRPRLHIGALFYLLRRFSARERIAGLKHWRFPATEIEAVNRLLPETKKLVRLLSGRKMDDPRQAYAMISKLPLGTLAFLLAEFGKSRAANKVKNYVEKWRPMRLALPVAELDALGVPRGAKFDKILEDFFAAELKGKVKQPTDRPRLLRQFAGIKEEAPKKEEKKRAKGKAERAAQAARFLKARKGGSAAEATAATAKPAAKEATTKAAPQAKAKAKRKPVSQKRPKRPGSKRTSRSAKKARAIKRRKKRR
jgi:tRNA nucleotidyltransferase (CCA-adding enzyme)